MSKNTKNLSEKEYQAFWEKTSNNHFMQSYEWGQACKKNRGQIPCYIGLKNEDIVSLKLTELPIADRYSIGSQITKRELNDAFIIVTLTRQEKQQVKISSFTDNTDPEEIEILDIDEDEKQVSKKKKISLKEIDDRLMTIDDFLN